MKQEINLTFVGLRQKSGRKGGKRVTTSYNTLATGPNRSSLLVWYYLCLTRISIVLNYGAPFHKAWYTCLVVDIDAPVLACGG